jgi:uncharacterized protein
MTNEERQLISEFVARVGGNAPGGFSRSVPTTAPALPPIDPEADRFIAEQFQTHPEARYRITQMAVVQEAALAEAASRLQQMQAALEQAQQQARQAQQGAQPQSRGFLGGLFGGSSAPPPPQQSPWNQGQQQQYAPPPQQQDAAPQYPPNVQPGMFQQGGSGFLGSALTTAAGVAGGVVAGNLLMDMFSGHGGGGLGGGGFGGGGFGGGAAPQETFITNNYGSDAPGQQDPGGGWDNNVQSQTPDPGWDDNTQAPDAGGGGWDDNSGGGGWDDNSNG